VWLLVKTAEDLAKHRTTRTGVFAQIRQVSAVESVTDMSAISQATLDVILLKPTDELKRREPTVYNAIRHYWRRQRQPELPLFRRPRRNGMD